MAINLNSGDDSSACSSPRISFSHDLPEINSTKTQEEAEEEDDVITARLDMSLLLDQNSDFNFCASVCFPEDENDYSPADELFFNGVIIPTQMKEKLNSIDGSVKTEEKEITSTTTATLVRQEKNLTFPSKSFWRFRRSCSLNYENYGQKKSSSIWSIPNLFRSKSTGSSSNYIPKQIQKCSSSNNNNNNSNGNKLMNNQSARFSTSSCHKPPLRKSGSGSGCGGVRNGAALNVPPPYIVKGTSDLLGFTSLFGNGSRGKKSRK